MTQTAAPPVLTVRYDGAERTFAAGHDVVIGRDLRADVRVAHPLISRVHLLLRFDQGRWVAIDNGSLNGLYVNNRRVPVVDIQDGQRVNIGNPDGPALDFEVGRRNQGSVGRPPATTAMAIPSRPSGPIPAQGGQPPSGANWGAPPQHPSTARMPAAPPGQPSGPQPRYPSGPQPMQQPSPQIYRSSAQQQPPPVIGRTAEAGSRTSMMKILRPGKAGDLPAGAVKIGRADDNDIVIPEVLASRHHATLIPSPGGTEIRDNRSINGTFVNGTRVESAILRDGDVVTIGNIDLVFANGALSRREESLLETRTGGLDVRGVTWTIEGNKTLLDNISLTARPGMLTAVIGPSGAGKSTFAKLVAGYTHPTSGTVSFEGHNVHSEYASLRSRIGMVPQDDVVHGQLTVKQALMYAAELRLPPDTTKEDREQVVARVLEELEMTKHLETRVDKLSGGQRKRASVALELLTGPSLLILDEPTSGLDPALDRQVMTMLRQLADAGRVVLVVTHSLTYLDVCDQVLLLAPGGKTAFCGPPSQIGPSMGTTNWADIFSSVAEDPDGAKARYLAQTGPPPPVPPTEKPAELGEAAHTSLVRQFSTIARRQLRLIISDRGYFIFLAILPFIMGSLSMSVPGDVGFNAPPLTSDAPTEPAQILVLLNVGAVFMGTALTIRDLIGERAIFLRTGGRPVHHGLPAGEGLRLHHPGAHPVGDRDHHRAAGQAGSEGQRRGARKSCPRAVRGHRGDDRGLGHARPGVVVAGQDQRADHAASRGGGHVSAGVLRRHDPGDQPLRAGPDVVGHPGTLGLCDIGVHHRPDQVVSGAAGSQGRALETHGRGVDLRHGDAGGTQHLLPGLRAVEDSPQEWLTGTDGLGFPLGAHIRQQ